MANISEENYKKLIEFENALSDLITEILGGIPLSEISEYFGDTKIFKTIKETPGMESEN